MELWRDIRGYEGIYQVSNLGRVRSLDIIVMRKNGRQLTVKGRILSFTKNAQGYLVVWLYKNGKKKDRRIHQLVAEAFITNPNPKFYTVVHHKSRNKEDNRVENLEWMTKLEHDAEHIDERVKLVKKSLSKRVDQIDKISGEIIKH